ncbi:MAG: N-acetylmuramoyl-L-alanine amidase family protein [Cellulosilyticaceae bacterium]
MDKKIMTAIVSIVIFCMSITSVYAAPMKLEYDGKTHTYDLAPITLYIDGEEVDTSLMPPVQLEGTTLVPVREVFEPMGAFVEWKEEEKKVYIDYNGTLLILEMNNKEVWKNGEIIKLDIPAKVINNKIMVPVRFISEQMGFAVQWLGDTREIHITGQKIEVAPPEVIEPEVPEIEEPSFPKEDGGDEKVDMSDFVGKVDGVTEIYEGFKNKHKVYVDYKSNAKTTINTIAISQNGSTAIGMIQANSPITDIEATVSEGKIIVDIPNSTNGLKSSITPDANGYVSGIRTSQYEKDKTRVVFDLKAGVSTKITLTSDRKAIMIEMDKQLLEAILVGQDRISDYIAIDNIAPNQMKVAEELGQMTINIANVYVDETIDWNSVDGEYIKTVKVSNTSNGIQIVMQLNDEKLYFSQVQSDKGDTIIRLVKPEFKNISYASYNKILTLDAPSGLSASDIRVEDLYREKKLILDLGDNYEEHFGKGTYKVGDQVVNNIQIINDRTTKIIINESSIHAVNVKDTAEGIQIKLVKPQEKYGKILVLDAGHGGNDGGSSGNGLKEKEVNFKQTMVVKNLIEKNTDIKVYMTREDDSTLTLAFRTDLANDINADMFVSIHNNSASPAAKGTELLYYPNSSDTRSKQIAKLMQDNIVKATGMYNRGIKERPDLYVLRTSKMPAVLIEGGFLSNAEDAAKLKSEDFTQKYAYAVYEAIVEAFNTLSFR